MSQKTTVSSLERLRRLPEVFTHKTAAAMFGWETDMASQYITRWKQSGFVSSLGERAGVHFNLLKNPRAASEHLLAAVNLVFPGAILVGASAIHMAGATTQIPSRPQIAIPWRPSYPKVDGADLSMRSIRWFRAVHSELIRDAELPRLPVELALADDWENGDWRPDPDDIDWDEIDHHRLRAAFMKMGGEIPDLWLDSLDEDDESRPGW